MIRSEDLERRLRAMEARIRRSDSVLAKRDAALLLFMQLRTKRIVIDLSPLAIGSQDIDITWAVPFADNLYWVGVELVTGAAGIGTVHAQLKVGSRTPEGCTVAVVATAAVGVAVLDVLGIRP